jgi:hypothetical protein
MTNYTMITEKWIEKDVEGSDPVLIYGIFPEVPRKSTICHDS